MIEWVMGNTPEVEGWYRVLHPGDSESIDGHTIYEYGDYEGWAYWSVHKVVELSEGETNGVLFEAMVAEQEEGWTCEHGEDGESIMMYCGPFVIPDRLPLST